MNSVLPLNFYRVQFAYLLFSSVTASFSLYLVWHYSSNDLSTSRLGLVLGLASLAGFAQFVFLSFQSIHSRERKLSLRLSVCAILAVLLPLALGGNVPIALLAGAIILSICGAFVATASVAIIPQTSPKEHAVTAFSHKTAMFSFEPLLGPMLAGAVLTYFGGTGYLMGAIAFLVVILVLFSQSDFHTQSVEPTQMKAGLNGIKLLWGVRTELWIATISAIFNFAFTPFLILIMPLVILDNLGLGPLHVGLMQGAFAAGLFLGSSYLVRVANLLFGSRYSIVVGGVAMSLAIMSFAVVENFIYLLGVQALAGMGLALFNVNATKIRSLATPIQYRSMLESSFMLACMSTIPVGMWVFGTLAAYGTLNVALLFCGGCLLIASVMVLAVPYLSSLAKMKGEVLDGAYARYYPQLFSLK
ncbi:MFS transporter [Salinispirillum sp. LH 10-3-1]|uniref:MFS transporter n=1 Tax=Salinispirillum sp. LH 10-3-1 TaxID=2952525 RepID=A0AB38YGF3_9GAMM